MFVVVMVTMVRRIINQSSRKLAQEEFNHRQKQETQFSNNGHTGGIKDVHAPSYSLTRTREKSYVATRNHIQ